jgi:uncharacterized protein (TIGR02594 family)
MRAFVFLIVFSTLTACDVRTVEFISPQEQKTIVVNNNNPVITGFQYINFTETANRAELKELMNVDPKRTEWCAAFVNAVLEESDIESNKDHAYPLTARAFLDWGMSVPKEDIQPGDLVVFPRGNQGWQGHVGFYLKTQEINGVEYYYILGGNQDNRVSIVSYRANRALGIRRQSPTKRG